MAGFDTFRLSNQLLDALKKMNYSEPTPIQEKSLPVSVPGRDIIGCAQTGTGKTAAFLLPMINQLLHSSRKCGLVLVPTRELADQVAVVARELTHFCPEISVTVIIGGVSMNGQIRNLKNEPRIIIATPGRLVDHLRRGNISLRAYEVLVLDEADRMLDMGFLPFINEILRFVPSTRQTLLFSATVSPDIEKIARKYLRNPLRVEAGVADKPVETVTQKIIHVTGGEKRQALNTELKTRNGSVLIFTRTKHRADALCKYLVTSGHVAGRIHGGRTQGQRTRTLGDFKDGKLRVLVATDVVSRGIDISNIGHVINFDVPQTPEEYVHRIGRTARAGEKGEALSLISPEEKMDWKRIHTFLKRQNVHIN